ncbi:MAG: hypothetical protein EBZ50_09705 [Alphaproteobacteria bacterium]|nr:hypothetical protein [Alphaproteobacteria bacterium]
MTGKKTGFGSLMMFLSIQAAMFMVPAAAHVPAPAEPRADAAAHEAGPLEGLSGLVERLNDAAEDAFSFRWFEAPTPENHVQIETYPAAPLAPPVEVSMASWTFEPVFETADLAALVKMAVESAQGDWLF